MMGEDINREVLLRRFTRMKKSINNLVEDMDILEDEMSKVVRKDYKLLKKIEANRPRCNNCGTANMRARFRTNELYCRSCGNLQKMKKKGEK